MVPTHALLAAIAAVAEPTPVPSLPPPPDVTQFVARGELMRFDHPVMTNPFVPTPQPTGRHADAPRRNGGGNGMGGMGGSTGTTATAADATTSAATATAATNSGVIGQTLPAGWTQTDTPTDPNTPTLLAAPTAPAADPQAATAWYALSPDTTARGGTVGTSAVVADELHAFVSPPVPTPTPEPGTLILLALAAAGVGGGPAVRKWVRRKR